MTTSRSNAAPAAQAERRSISDDLILSIWDAHAQAGGTLAATIVRFARALLAEAAKLERQR